MPQRVLSVPALRETRRPRPIGLERLLQTGISDELKQPTVSHGRRTRGSASTSKSKTTPDAKTAKSTGPYDRAFQQHLIDWYSCCAMMVHTSSDGSTVAVNKRGETVVFEEPTSPVAPV
ncbi:hypothetical protein QBC46DRAFT_338054 [Diplogelasinospora grovesii]|uniref:Uncharacterized protein n=1 Tax=Diplogelasinospora grovesii TaxID=303347 RepID=A0AAN6NEJ7_9PEZI|nr:hypothetical protein QBC46DRAFT_338054 [Diplogelasinospora grovesii]